MQGQAPAVGDERPDDDARLHRPVGPDPADGAGVRTAPDGLEPFEDLHRPDLGGAGDGATGKGRRQDVEGVAFRGQHAGHGGDEVLDRGGPFETAEPWNADAPGPADATQVVAQDVHDHHVLGPVLVAGQELTGERPVGCGVAAARTRPLDRICLDHAIRIDRQERFRRGRQERPGTSGQLPGPEIEIGGEERRIAGPQMAIEVPRVAIEGRFEATGGIRLVEVAPGDVVANPGDAGLVGRSVHPRSEEERRRVALALGRVAVGPRAWRRQPGVNVVQAARQPAAVPVEGAATDPGMAGPAVPRHDPVVEGQAEQREVLVRRRDRGQALERRTKVVSEEPDEPSEERRRTGRDDDGAVEPGDQPPGDRERVGACGGRFEDRDRVRDEIRPTGIPAGAGALEEGQAGEVAEGLGSIDGPGRGDPVRQPPEAKRRAGAGRRDHRRMIRPVAGPWPQACR